MKEADNGIGLIAAVVVLGFMFVWFFVPDKKQAIQHWWYGMTIDCDQIHSEVSHHHRCKISDDCELVRSESIRADELEVQYGRYFGKL